MASLEDALKKAGLQGTAEADAAPAAEKPAAKEPPAALEERPCTKCGTVFMPKMSKHRLCPKCAEEHFTASKEKKPGAARPAGEKPAGERPAALSSEGREKRSERPPRDRQAADKTQAPRPERRDKPPRREGPREGTPREGAPRRDQAQREPVQREAPQGFPRDYLQSGYFTGNVMRDELFDTWARHVAGLLVSRNLSGNQMRAFYAHVRRADDSSKAGRDFKEVREELLKMRPAAAARLGRKLIPSEFADFLDRNIEQVKDARTLGAFVEHFQGVVGYTAGRLKK